MIQPGDTLQDVVMAALKCKHVKIVDDAIYANSVAYMFEAQSVVNILKRCHCGVWFDVSGCANPHKSIMCPGCRQERYLKSPRLCVHNNEQAAKRVCLMCGKKFDSSGPHNRRCEKCNLSAEILGDNVLYKTPGKLCE